MARIAGQNMREQRGRVYACGSVHADMDESIHIDRVRIYTLCPENIPAENIFL